jgi:hypothetical protein
MKLLRTIIVTLFTGSLIVASGCGGVFGSIFGDDDDDKNNASSSGSSGLIIGGNPDAGGTKKCENLCLRQKACTNGSTTSLSGIIKDPAGKVPLYNVLVYVPNAPVAPITQGASCDRCGSVSGEPLVTALTGVDGKFKLDNVPVGADIPLVIQIGKWRRQLKIPNVAECVDTGLNEGDIRLPRKKSEGDIPQIALTTGGADTMECWLRKVGLDDSEFTLNNSDGRVHFYQGAGSSTRTFDASRGGGTFPPATGFWDNQANLMKYDIVILSCEGETFSAQKPPNALNAMSAYADAGGRIFASHWHRYWFSTAQMINGNGQVQHPAGPQPSPFAGVAAWVDHVDPCSGGNCSVQGTINTGFPKGAAMKDWLGQPTVNALTGGTLPIVQPRHNVDSTTDKATTWITATNGQDGNKPAVEYLSFNTPIPAADDQKCGRVVYNSLHVTTEDRHGQNLQWPSQTCLTADLTPQEKALEFMLFDLSSCIQSDKEAPQPPSGVN